MPGATTAEGTPVTQWDEWAALQEEEDRLHNCRPPGETSSESAASDGGGVGTGPSHRRRRMHALFDPS